MIIFGWGHQKAKDYGPTIKRRCDHCNNESFFNLISISTWFTLFFIPVFPYSAQRFLNCPICAYGLQLEDKQFNEIKPLAESNKLLINGEITEKEYQIRLGQLSNQNKNEIEMPKQTESVENLVEIEESEISYCRKCGNKLDGDNKFCSKCGEKI